MKVIQRISSYFRISSKFEQIKSLFYKDVSSYYEVLGIDESASNDEVKKAYRKMAIRHHPDKFSQLGEEQQKAAKNKFQKIQEAYEHIKKGKVYKIDEELYNVFFRHYGLLFFIFIIWTIHLLNQILI